MEDYFTNINSRLPEDFFAISETPTNNDVHAKQDKTYENMYDAYVRGSKNLSEFPSYNKVNVLI